MSSIFYAEELIHERERVHNGSIDNEGRRINNDEAALSQPFADNATDRRIRSVENFRNSVKQTTTAYLPITETHHLSSYLEVLSQDCKDRMRHYEEIIATREVPNAPSGFFSNDLAKSVLDTEVNAQGFPVQVKQDGSMVPISPTELAVSNFAAICGMNSSDVSPALVEFALSTSPAPPSFAQIPNFQVMVGRESQYLLSCLTTAEEMGNKITSVATGFDDGSALGEKLVGLTISPYDFLPSQ